MNKNNSRSLLVKVAGFLGVAGLSVLISLPGLAQQSPDNTSPNVPSTVKPTNPGSRDAGTTNDGDSLNRVPSSGNQTPNSGSGMSQNSTNQPSGTVDNSDPTSRPGPVNRVEGRDQTNQDRNSTSPNGNSSPSGSYRQPGANQPGATTGGDSSQQVDQNQNGSPTTPQRSNQSSPQPRSQSDTNSGSTTDSTSTSQQNSNGSVRALW